jgi:pyridoxal phosphate enzyme (YggS family)
MNIVDRFNKIRASIPSNVRIVAVSKTKPVQMIEELHREIGHTIFGENKAQEVQTKQSVLPGEIEWHFIGHLQTNKIKLLAQYISLVQSVDSYKLLYEIDKEAKKNNRIIPCLLQFHIAKEEAKFGFSLDEAKKMLDSLPANELTNISVMGVMGMATFTKDITQIKAEFKLLYSYFNTLKSIYYSESGCFNEISMGMSDDYHVAIDEGSTMIRIGSGIFGGR